MILFFRNFALLYGLSETSVMGTLYMYRVKDIHVTLFDMSKHFFAKWKCSMVLPGDTKLMAI